MTTTVEIYWQDLAQDMPPLGVPVLAMRQDKSLTIGIFNFLRETLRCWDYSAKSQLEGSEFPTHWSCNYRVI